jgi:hypothetical protein
LLFLFSLVLYLASGPLNKGTVLRLASVVVVAIFAQTAFFVVAFAVALWLAWLFLERKQLAPAVGCAMILLGIGVMLMLRAAVAGKVETHRHENTVILWESNNPYYESMKFTSLYGRRPGNPWSQWKASTEEQQRYDDYLKRAKASRRDPAVLWIKENPAQYAKMCWIRLYTTLGPFTGQMSPRHRLIATFYWLLIFPVGYYGLWRMRHLPVSRMAALVFVALTAFEVLVIIEWYLRYRMPWELILTLYAAVGYMHILCAESSKRGPDPGPALIKTTDSSQGQQVRDDLPSS